MLTQILEYQSKESKLLSLERELNNNPTKSALVKMVGIVKEEQNKLIVLENKAKDIFEGFDKCKAEYVKLAASLEKLIATSVDDKTEKELSDLNKKITDMSAKLTSLGRSVSQSAMQANQILKDFEKVKKNIIDSKTKHKTAKEEFDKVVANIEPQIQTLKSELAALEKAIDPKIMSKYKHSRQDGIFPVFVPSKNNSCGGCSMSLSAVSNSKLKEQGYVECEQCRRLIYNK